MEAPQAISTLHRIALVSDGMSRTPETAPAITFGQPTTFRSKVDLARLTMSCLAIASTLALTMRDVHAVPITLTDTAFQTTSGENFAFSFTGVPKANGTDGILTIHARGDYSVSTSSELLDWDIDGVVTGSASPPLGATVLTVFDFNDVEWVDTFAISGSLLSTIASNSQILISLDLASAVNQPVLGSFNPNAFVDVSLSYEAIPEPSTFLLGTLGLLGLVSCRRRKRT